MPPNRTPLFLVAAWLATAAAVASLSAVEPSLSGRFRPLAPADWKVDGTPSFVEVKGVQPAVAVFTVPAGGAGFYAITDSSIRRDTAVAGRIELGLQVIPAGARAGQEPPPAVQTMLDAGEWFDFDAFLGYLDVGDMVRLSVGPADDGPAGDRAEIDCRITRAPSIPVSLFPEDLRAPVALRAPRAWSLAADVAAESPVARRLAWRRETEAGFTLSADSARVAPGPIGRESVAAFRVPQSGYYALHDTWLAAESGTIEARIFVGDETVPRRVASASPASGRVSLNTALGYLGKGESVWIAFAGEGGIATFAGSVVEWAPRRAPLRVRRGSDGLLDVFEPNAPRQAVDIPAARWVAVPAAAGDTTDAIRRALEQARRLARDGSYAGVRLETGKTYTVASLQNGGTVFGLRDAQRLIFDGNGATLRVNSPELTRTEVNLFSLAGSRNLAFADFVVEASSVPFTTGEILDVSPRGKNTQTVTFRLDPNALDPLADISRDGRNNGYAYDPHIPGRLALGTWTHYPGSGSPSIRATDTPGVFTHRVTRTNDSIEPGGKWLVKNKRGGVIYLTTRAGTENVTLSGIDGRAAGGGQLRFWQTSGINLLDCRFEPDCENWISSSADGVHGRGREGVWIENTLIRGVCEDIMNTYGQNMVVVADGDEDDAVISLRMFLRSSASASGRALGLPTDENVMPGDQLVFFDPHTGRVLGYAGVVSLANGRCTLTHSVPGVHPWEKAGGKNATLVYNTRAAGRFFVRDSRLMDSMRFGIYIKARGGVIFGTQFEGLSGPSVFATNEPEWPEGPPATHLWVQGCVFSQNNHGYMPRHRDFMVVDPADISVYTRRLRDPAEPDDHRAHLSRGQHANSHMKFLGNVFHDWRGMGVSVRNAHNVRIEDNLFLPPVNDEVLRATLADDPTLNQGDRGAYAAIFLSSVDGVRVRGNRFHGLPAGDREVACGEDVTGTVIANNTTTAAGRATLVVSLSFNEWFGATSAEAGSFGAVIDRVALGGATHRPGRLGAGLHFSGGPPAVLAASADTATARSQFAVALWICPEHATGSPQTVFAQGDVGIAIDAGRWRAGLGPRDQWLDLGPAAAGLWQHLTLAFDSEARTVRGFIDGQEIARRHAEPPSALPTRPALATLGGETFRGSLDEFRLWHGVPDADDLAALALRRRESRP